MLAPQLYALQEQLHWLVLICGHLVADSFDGEVPMVPRPLLNLGQVDNPILSISSTIFQTVEALAFNVGSVQVLGFM